MSTNSSVLQAQIGRLGALAGVIALACLASPAIAAKDPPPPEVAKPVVTAIAATDAALRDKFKEYVGLSRNQEGTVFLTLSEGANLDEAANLSPEVWTATSGKEAKLPNFEFIEAAATPEER